jgi:3D (Asp-Asp-Asp) domain-containing protein
VLKGWRRGRRNSPCAHHTIHPGPIISKRGLLPPKLLRLSAGDCDEIKLKPRLNGGKTVRPKTTTLAIVCAVALAGLFGPGRQPSYAQEGNRKPACGCYICETTPGYVTFEDPSKNCFGIVPMKVCREALEEANLPESTRDAFWERVRLMRIARCPKEGPRSEFPAPPVPAPLPPRPNATPSPNEKSCKDVSMEVSRSSLLQTSSTGDPQPGANPAFKYSANPSSAATYSTSDANANPSTGDLKAPANPSGTGEPSPGALADLAVSYTCQGGDTVTKKFSVATFGLSCYRFSVENDFIIPALPPTPTPTPDPTSTPAPTSAPASSPTPTPSPPLNCTGYTILGTRHTGVTTNPSGLPPGDYCTAFLADTRLQGSGITRNETKIQYVGGSPWRFTVVTEHLTADGQLPIPGGSVARDRQIVGGRGTTTVKLERGDFVANDTGGAIKGYRLDIFGGTGLSACRGFQNRMEIGACNPGSDKCPELKSPIP